MDSRYVEQVQLILNILPDIAEKDMFALKGGTAINLFHRDMPRLSVDIDLTYLPIRDWQTSLKDISDQFDRIATTITARHPKRKVQKIAGGGGNETRMIVRDNRSEVKIEVSPVMRGTVVSPVVMTASNVVIDQFGFIEANVLAFEDLYAGKLLAALDRQHPRDLYDVMIMYENEGLTEELFRVFLVYVAGSRRPIHEVLAPNARFDEALYEAEFKGMTKEPVNKAELVASQARLHEDIGARLRGDIASFLLSLHDTNPDFNRIGFPGVNNLPAIRWKQLNLIKLKKNNPKKHAVQREALEKLLR